MSRRQQQALSSGLLKEVRFGCSEAGLQHFHEWLTRILAADTADLNSLFPAESGCAP
jgi:hypothetical protein